MVTWFAGVVAVLVAWLVTSPFACCVAHGLMVMGAGLVALVAHKGLLK